MRLAPTDAEVRGPRRSPLRGDTEALDRHAVRLRDRPREARDH
jgi:hypothetical protein